MENTTCKSHFSTRKRQRANFIGSRTRNLACGDPRSLKRPNRQPFSPNISNQSNIFKCPAETYKLLFESTKVHCVLYQESLDKCFSRFRFQVHLQKAILLNPLSTKRFTNSNSLRIINQKTKNCIYTHFNETLLFQQIPTLSTPHKQYLIIKIQKYIKIPQKPINQTPVQCKPTSQKSRFHKASNHFQYVFFFYLLFNGVLRGIEALLLRLKQETFASFLQQIIFPFVLSDLHQIVLSPPPRLIRIDSRFVPLLPHLRSRARSQRHVVLSAFLPLFLRNLELNERLREREGRRDRVKMFKRMSFIWILSNYFSRLLINCFE